MIQERIFEEFPAVTLPELTEEEDRGYFRCCVIPLVLANSSGKTDENDTKSAWMKLSGPGDSVTFKLLNDAGDETAYIPTAQQFINETFAFFTTVNWSEVLASDGVGCYSIKVEYSIGGLDESFTWGRYNLEQFSIENAKGTARIRSVFNLNQRIEGINFTGSGVEDCIRFKGQIKPDQPNNKYENLLYESRRVETVLNEGIPTYKMETDPYTDEVLRSLEQLYLLSSNEIFLTDHNAHTSSYDIKDIPVIVDPEGGPERETVDRYVREEVLTCKFNDRTQDKITNY